MAKNEKKQNNEVNLEKMDQVSGGFLGHDKYDQATYSRYGVSHQKNVWSKDQYWINGQKATQKEAENYVDSRKFDDAYRR